MEQLLQKQAVTVTGSALEATEDYVLSGDFILPEYCPDVAVVLKCLITPHIQSRRFSGDVLTLDGMALVRVLYLDEERRCVREAEFTQPINCSLRGQSGCDTTLPRVSVTTDYVNCRAVSPRRIEVRGGLTISAVAYKAEALDLPALSDSERLFTRGVQKTVTAPLAAGEKIVTVNETLDFDSALPPAEQLLGGDCAAIVTDCKLLNDKAIVKGQICLHQLYTNDSTAGTTHVLDYTVPFSLIMDMEGVRDGHLHTADVSVLSDIEECVSGTNGPNSAIEFTAKLLVQLYVYESAQANLVLDAYHADCPVTLNTKTLSLRSLFGALRHGTTVQKSVALPETALQEILDAWILPQAVSGRQENGLIQMDAQVLVCLLVRDVEGTVAYFERPEDIRFDCPQTVLSSVGDADCDVQARLSVQGVSYAALGDKLDLRMTLLTSIELWESVEEQVVGDITLHTDAPYPTDGTAIRLYYAQPGENLWDIARLFHTAPGVIREENDLREDILSAKTVLLVPMD